MKQYHAKSKMELSQIHNENDSFCILLILFAWLQHKKIVEAKVSTEQIEWINSYFQVVHKNKKKIHIETVDWIQKKITIFKIIPFSRLISKIVY